MPDTKVLLLAAASLAVIVIYATPAEAAPGDACDGDGTAAAPAGAPQYPKLFAGYAAVPPCGVVGVTFRAGRAAGLPALKVPGVARFPKGFTWTGGSPASRSVRCDGATDAVFENWDMRGVSLNITSTCSGTRVRNNLFAVTYPGCAGVIQLAGPNTTFEYNDVDGGGYAVGVGCNVDNTGEGVYFTATATGTQTYRYNHNHDQIQHFVSFGNARVDMRFNLHERTGFFQGAHTNFAQMVGSVTAPRVQGNLFISDQPHLPLGATDGTFSAGSNTIANVRLIAAPGQHSFYAGQAITGKNVPRGATLVSASVAGNIATIVMSAKATGSGVAPFDVANAYPVGMGHLRIVSQYGNINDADVSDNVIIARPGPHPTVSYAIYCATEGATTNTNAKLNRNYMDLRGALGGFYPNHLCSPRSGAGNVNMVTGAKIPIP